MTISSAIIHDALVDAMQRQLEDVQLISIRQAAKLMDVSDRTARTLLGTGVDVGGKGYKVKLADVRRVIAERTIKLP